MNKDPESWARVSVDAVCAGSPAQVRNVLAMVLDDIKTLSMQEAYWRELAIVHCRRAVAELQTRREEDTRPDPPPVRGGTG